MLRLAWRNLSQSRLQFFIGVGGVALALLLMLSLDALLNGSESDLIAYIVQSGADVFIAQSGVKNMHMAASSITRTDIRRAARTEGVSSASPILYTISTIETGQAHVLTYVIGFDPNEPLGGPMRVIQGKKSVNRDEVIIDIAVARTQSLALADKIDILGETFTIVGITQGLTNIVNSVVFIHMDDFQALRNSDVFSYALVRIEQGYDPTSVAEAINVRVDAVTALSQKDFAREEAQIIKDMSVEIIYLMNLSGLLIGLAVTALTLYTSTLSKRQEYGVLKAIGAKNTDLYTVIIGQAVLSLSLGFGLAVSMVWVMGLLLPFLSPGLNMKLTMAGITRVLSTSLIIGIAAALAPAWQIARLDPARVFRG